MNDSDTKQRAAARAAYRLGAVDAILTAIAEGDLEMPGIFREVLEGERKHRILELKFEGVDVSDLADLRVLPK